ncbi:MAG TPA: hypothetical protein VK501_17650 [Baekduia sp.]|uniref:hypothetical protein n=1 Tax=Baekduia sp. TaxID=2600305 RepID=UPI002B908DAD|nr:hypothetical protein [Baekduia sp.]HMJ35733.1 hypothetical protein [Baekduia sp.]
MTRRGLFKIAPVSTKSVGITAARPDPQAVLGSAAMRDLVRVGSTKPRKHTRG